MCLKNKGRKTGSKVDVPRLREAEAHSIHSKVLYNNWTIVGVYYATMNNVLLARHQIRLHPHQPH